VACDGSTSIKQSQIAFVVLIASYNDWPGSVLSFPAKVLAFAPRPEFQQRRQSRYSALITAPPADVRVDPRVDSALARAIFDVADAFRYGTSELVGTVEPFI
jgi:hypothetical protein